MAKLILAVSILAGAGACSPAPASQPEPSPTTTTALVTTTEATTTTEVTTTTEPTTEPPTTEPTTEATVPPTTRARSAPTTEPSSPQSRTVRGDTPPEYIKQCESGGDYSAVNPTTGAGGAWQFLPSTWRSVGGTGLPQNASPAEQDYRAAILWDGGRGAGHWACA